ncbi:hypothetical protein DI272_34830 [Streptomyces sp. Act143]|nr:hypothetical protein DI272_34830 [Streptomyces sp. Act143]
MLAVLAGVLGMHALSPGGAPPGDHPYPSAMTGLVSVSAPHEDCGGKGHCGSGHMTHADATCSAAAVSGGPVLPAPVADPVAGVVRDDVLRACAVADPDGARAPPSLAELQLLRI